MIPVFEPTYRLASRLTLVAAIALAAACESPPPALQTDEQQGSYVIGYQTGRQLAMRYQDEIKEAALVDGLRDGLAESESRISAPEQQQIMERLSAVVAEKREASSLRALDAGREFLARNAKREGVTTTASGLQYEVLTEGDGDTPGPRDVVETHYHGTLIDGTVFDSSVVRGDPIEFPVNGVIKGWTEALQLMQVGDKWRLYVPSDLAYGARGAGGAIGPNETLIFDVELLGVKPS